MGAPNPEIHGIKLRSAYFFGGKKTGDKARVLKSTKAAREIPGEHIHPPLKCQRPHVHLHRAQVYVQVKKTIVGRAAGSIAFT